MKKPDPKAPQYRCVVGMKVVVLGGANSGKTSLVARILHISYQKLLDSTAGIGIHTISDFSFWDIPGSLLNATRSIHDYLFDSTNGVLLIIDSSSSEGCQDALKWIHLMRHYLSEKIPVIVLANKADTSMKHITPQFLDSLLSQYLFSSWYWTVGHVQYGDYDFRRGRQSKQLSVNEVVVKLEKLMKQQQNEEESFDSYFNSLEPFFPSPTGYLSPPAHDQHTLFKPSGWEYYGGVMTREDAEQYLRGSVVGRFLLRRSDVSFQLRVTIVTQAAAEAAEGTMGAPLIVGAENTFSHILFKQTNSLNHHKNNGSDDDSRGRGETAPTLVTIGRKEFKGRVFRDVAEALFDGLKLLPADGLTFTRVVTHNGARFLPSAHQPSLTPET
jgi:small GTP-binding protein